MGILSSTVFKMNYWLLICEIKFIFAPKHVITSFRNGIWNCWFNFFDKRTNWINWLNSFIFFNLDLSRCWNYCLLLIWLKLNAFFMFYFHTWCWLLLLYLLRYRIWNLNNWRNSNRQFIREWLHILPQFLWHSC